MATIHGLIAILVALLLAASGIRFGLGALGKRRVRFNFGLGDALAATFVLGITTPVVLAYMDNEADGFSANIVSRTAVAVLFGCCVATGLFLGRVRILLSDRGQSISLRSAICTAVGGVVGGLAATLLNFLVFLGAVVVSSMSG